MRLSAAAVAALRAGLPDPGLLPFARAAATLLAHPAGAPGDAAVERGAVAQVVALLALTGEEVPERLLADPPLFAAVYQSLDLLPDGAHVLPLAVLAAVERAASTPD